MELFRERLFQSNKTSLNEFCQELTNYNNAMSKESVKEKVLKNFLRGEEIVFEGLARYLVRKGRRCIDRRVAFVHFFHSHFFVLFNSRFCTVFVCTIFH